MAPIGKLVVYFQSDRVPVSEVYEAFIQLQVPSQFADAKLNDFIQLYITELIKKRWEFMYGKGYGVAYLLDPWFLGDGITGVDFKKVLGDFIFSYPP